jgi:hypothetical protein
MPAVCLLPRVGHGRQNGAPDSIRVVKPTDRVAGFLLSDAFAHFRLWVVKRCYSCAAFPGHDVWYDKNLAEHRIESRATQAAASRFHGQGAGHRLASSTAPSYPSWRDRASRRRDADSRVLGSLGRHAAAGQASSSKGDRLIHQGSNRCQRAIGQSLPTNARHHDIHGPAETLN